MNERPHAALAEILGTLHAVETRLEAALEPLGLSLAKFKALSMLVAAGEPLPLRTLAEQCACVRSNITQLMDRLEADKLVTRTDDPDDRRSIRAELTAEGRARYKAGSRAVQAVENEVLGRLPKGQREALLGLLKSLRAEAGVPEPAGR
jgi:DNA-binding MarR family transcriptional regulator